MKTFHRRPWRWLWMTPKQRAKWEPVRRAGAFRFIAIRGVLAFGGSLAAVGCLSAYVYAVRFREILNQAFPGAADPMPSFMRSVLPGTIIASLLAGAIWGTFVWLFQQWVCSLPQRT
jgi:hypothetical protein